MELFCKCPEFTGVAAAGSSKAEEYAVVITREIVPYWSHANSSSEYSVQMGHFVRTQ